MSGPAAPGPHPNGGSVPTPATTSGAPTRPPVVARVVLLDASGQVVASYPVHVPRTWAPGSRFRCDLIGARAFLEPAP